jgi:hypothetical protein
MTTTTKQTRMTYDLNLRNGVAAHLTAGLVISSAPVPQTGLIATLDERIAAGHNVAAAHAAYQKAVADEHDVIQRTTPTVAAIRDAVHVMFRGQPAILAEFGLAARKTPAARTVEEKAAAKAKSLATRAARKTMGSRQRAKVQGTPAPAGAKPPAAAAPPPAPPAATPTPAPAPTTPTPPTPIAPPNGPSHA